MLEGWLQDQFGLYMVGSPISKDEIIYLSVAMGVLVGLVPFFKASRSALKDGLSVRV
jgi:hypothetical protein